MPDPVPLLAAVGATALTEGIKFLYGQAGEILKSWRERRSEAAQENEPTEATSLTLPESAFEGNLTTAAIHFDRVRQLERQLRKVRRDLSDYADGVDEVDENDAELLANVDTLRCMLEAIYGQRITFKGEDRPASGAPVVVGRVDAKGIAGVATGVDAEAIAEGEVRGEVKADRVEKGARATGIRVKTIGGKPS